MKKVMLAIGVIALGSCVQNTSSKVSDVNVKDTIVKDTIVIVKDTIPPGLFIIEKDTIVIIVKDHWYDLVNIYDLDTTYPYKNVPDSLHWDYEGPNQKTGHIIVD
jgi:hypothetical protein